MVRSSFVRSCTKVVTLFSLLVGCDQPQAVDPGIRPGADRFVVSINPERDSVLVGATLPLTATVIDALGAARTDQTVRWSSLAPDKASVDGIGLVTGVAAGAAQVVATVGMGAQAHADTAVILVQAGVITLSIAPELAEITLGDSLPLEIMLQSAAEANLRGMTAQWSSSDTSIARISSDGIVTSLAPGDVTLMVHVSGLGMAGGLTATSNARVLPNPAASISVSPANAGLNPDETTQLKATVLDGRGRLMPTGKVRWSTSSPAVAMVTMDGLLYAKTKGSAVITATLDARKASATITVFSVPAATVSVSAPSNSVSLGGRLQAVATARDASGNVLNGKSVAWSSSNPAVAQVGADGMITGLVVGSTSIHAIIDSKVGTMPIAVTTANPSAIVVLPATATVSLGKTAQLTAEVRDQTGNAITGMAVTWTSSNTSIATVTGSGLVTAVSSGTATITARAGTLSAQASIVVIPASIASVSVSPASSQLQIGGAQQLSATVRDASGNQVPNAATTWSSSNPAVVTVSALGVASAISGGNATITATSSGISGNASVAVSNLAPLPVNSVSVTFNSPSLVVGQSTQATAVPRDANGNAISGRTIIWSSDDEPLASVSANGLVTAIAGGSATIIAKVDGVIGYATLTISAPSPLPVYTVQLTIAPTAINAGQTASSNVVLRDSLGNTLSRTGHTIGWTSNKPFVASVGLGGIIVGVGAGAAIITATSSGKSGLAGLSVNGTSLPSIATVTVSAGATSLTPTQTTQATATARDSTGNVLASQAVTWVSSNPSAATVTATGLVTGVAVGATTITATTGGKSGSAVITVSVAATASVTVSVPTSSLTVGQLTQAVATAKDANGNALPGKPIFWSSNNAAVASVNGSGVIAGISVGTATITASSEGKNATAVLTVTPGAPVGSVPSIAPTLPQQTVDVSWRAPTGQTIAVHAGGNLQAALNSAQRGDEIVIDAGATFTGNFTLPPKPGTSANGWITVRTSALSSLPALGSRIDASHYAAMPKIVTPNVFPALQTTYGVTGISGWRLVGLEITVPVGVGVQPTIHQGLVVLGTGDMTQNTSAKVPRDLIIDRSYIHGQTTTNLKRCLEANASAVAVIGSHLLECHGKGFDSQAIAEWNGPGPFLFENNRLEAAGEVIIFGGAISPITGLVASDITIRRNHITRPMTWKGQWTVKNLFELKNAQRVLVEENVFENHWVDGQQGPAMVMGSFDNPCTWCIVSDVTFRWNHIDNVFSVFNLVAKYGNAQPMTRVQIANNLSTNVGSSTLGAPGNSSRCWMLQDDIHDLWIERNTCFAPQTYVDVGGLTKQRLTFRENVGGNAIYVWRVSATSFGTNPLPLLSANCFVAPSSTGLPAGNTTVANVAALGFANPVWPGGDWSLAPTSACAGRGVDHAALRTKLVGVR